MPVTKEPITHFTITNKILTTCRLFGTVRLIHLRKYSMADKHLSTGAVILVRPFVIFDVEGMQVSHYAKNVAPIVTLHPVDSRHYVIMWQNSQI